MCHSCLHVEVKTALKSVDVWTNLHRKFKQSINLLVPFELSVLYYD